MESQTQPIPRSILFFVTFAAVGVCVWFLNAYSPIFNSFFLAVMIVMTASPIGFWLRNHGSPAWLALLLSVVAALAATFLIAGVLALSAVRMLDVIPELVSTLAEAEEAILPFLKRLGITPADLDALLTAEAVGIGAVRVIQMTLASVSMFGLVILIVVFMVLEAFLVPLKVKYSPDFDDWSPDAAVGFTINIRQYVGITSLLGLIGGGILSLVLFWLHIPFPLLWGVLYLVLNFVPMVGFWIALIPPLLLAAQTGGPTTAFLVLAAYVVVSTIINQGVKPAVMRGGLDLSPFWSIMSLIVWSSILGPAGFVVGVPLTIALKVLILGTDPKAQWVADLLGAGLPPGQDARQDTVLEAAVGDDPEAESTKGQEASSK